MTISNIQNIKIKLKIIHYHSLLFPFDSFFELIFLIILTCPSTNMNLIVHVHLPWKLFFSLVHCQSLFQGRSSSWWPLWELSDHEPLSWSRVIDIRIRSFAASNWWVHLIILIDYVTEVQVVWLLLLQWNYTTWILIWIRVWWSVGIHCMIVECWDYVLLSCWRNALWNALVVLVCSSMSAAWLSARSDENIMGHIGLFHVHVSNKVTATILVQCFNLLHFENLMDRLGNVDQPLLIVVINYDMSALWIDWICREAVEVWHWVITRANLGHVIVYNGLTRGWW